MKCEFNSSPCGVSVCHKLELERQQHNQLKHTWQRANDQFLESQRLLMRDMQRIESVLSSEQLRQVEEMKKKDQVHPVLLSLCYKVPVYCVWVDNRSETLTGRILCDLFSVSIKRLVYRLISSSQLNNMFVKHFTII